MSAAEGEHTSRKNCKSECGLVDDVVKCPYFVREVKVRVRSSLMRRGGNLSLRLIFTTTARRTVAGDLFNVTNIEEFSRMSHRQPRMSE